MKLVLELKVPKIPNIVHPKNEMLPLSQPFSLGLIDWMRPTAACYEAQCLSVIAWMTLRPRPPVPVVKRQALVLLRWNDSDNSS